MFAIVAMLSALLLGGGIASLLSPLTSKEESQFGGIRTILAGVVSGFTLGKIGDIVGFAKTVIPSPTPDAIEFDFLLLASFACFLMGLVFAFVLRAAFISRDENRRQLALRQLHEEQQIGH